MTKKKVLKVLLIALTVIVIVAAVGIVVFVNALNPTKKYERDIVKLKSKSLDYSFFPDEIPDDAKYVYWSKTPSIMQGSGYEYLSFQIDAAYIYDVIDTYGEGARIGVPKYFSGTDNIEGWVAASPPGACFIETEENDNGYDGGHIFNANLSSAKSIIYVKDPILDPKDKKYKDYKFTQIHSIPNCSQAGDYTPDMVAYVLYDNDNWNHKHTYGFYVVPSKNKIAFWRE